MLSSETMPRSRSDRLVIQDVQRETLVYDLDTHKAHCLNESAAIVWRMCDGRTRLADAHRALNNRLGIRTGIDVLQHALDQLEGAGLLDASFSRRTSPAIPGRRAMMKRIAAAGGLAVALPLVTSVIAPTAALAATCLASGAPCISSAQCCSGLCLAGGHCA